MTSHIPSDAPPSYESVAGATPNPPIRRVSTDGPGSRTERNGIPPEHRRSMEDESRPLPPGWVRQFDTEEQHQFFVDTNANPPRSTWVHPYDDDEFLATLSAEERREHGRMHRTMTLDDVQAESSDDEAGGHAKLPPRPTKGNDGGSSGDGQLKGIHKITRRMKDKLTSTTHEEREQHRVKRAEQERRAYVAHLQARQAMVRALQTGQPQLLGKDRQGRDVYIEPPTGPRAPMGAYGYSPFGQGLYGNPNARYMRPAGPYRRPYGYGYGGGLGAPVAAGLMGGALMGGLMF
jgi:hypothetical protein